MSKYSNKIAITTGDPNGIGAEVTIKALNLLNLPSRDIVIISNSKVINECGHLANNYELIEVDYNQTLPMVSGHIDNKIKKIFTILSVFLFF